MVVPVISVRAADHPKTAEALSGGRLYPQRVLERTGQDPATVLGRIRQQLEQAPGNDDWVVCGALVSGGPLDAHHFALLQSHHGGASAAAGS